MIAMTRPRVGKIDLREDKGTSICHGNTTCKGVIILVDNGSLMRMSAHTATRYWHPESDDRHSDSDGDGSHTTIRLLVILSTLIR